MQVQFDPKALDLQEAALVMGMVLPRMVERCQAQGETLEQVQAGMANLVATFWTKISTDETKG